MNKTNKSKLYFLFFALFLIFIITVAGCKQNDFPPTTYDPPEVQNPILPIFTPDDSCEMIDSQFACSTFSVQRSKITLNITNNFPSKSTVLDFRLKSDDASIFCVGSNTKTTAINTNPQGTFTLICDGIPTGRLPYNERDEIYFELDYKTGSDNTLRVAKGTIKSKVY